MTQEMKMKPKKTTKGKKAAEAEQVAEVAKAAKKEAGEESAPEEPQTFGLEASSGILVTGKANEIADKIRRMCVPVNSKESLVNPLPLRFQGNTMATEASSRFMGLFVSAVFPCEHDGEGEVAIDPVEFRQFLDLYGSQSVAIQFSQEGRVTIQGERRSSTFYALGEKPSFYKPSIEEREDGHVVFKNGKSTQWVASMKAKDISEAASPSNLFGVKTWTLLGDDTGLTIAIGTVEGKGRTVRTRVPVQFGDAENEDCGSEYGEDFGTLVNIISGDVELAFGGNVPNGQQKMAAVVRNGPVTYVVMSRKNQAE